MEILDPEKRIEAIKRKMEPSLDDAEPLLELAEAFMEIEMFEEAEFILGKALEAAPGDAQTLFTMADFSNRMGRDEDTEGFLREALDADADHEDALELLGAILVQSDRAADAIDVYERLVALEPDNVELRYSLGNLYDDDGDTDKALLEYEAALKIEPDHAQALNAIGLILADRGEIDAAIDEFRRAVDISPDYSNAHLNLAVAYRNHPSASVQDAEDEYKIAIKHDSTNEDALTGLAELYYEDKKFNRALEFFERAAAANPSSAEAWMNVGSASLMLGSHERALAAYRNSIRLSDKFAPPRFLIAKAYLNRGARLEAGIHLKRYLELEPDGEWVAEAETMLNEIKLKWRL